MSISKNGFLTPAQLNKIKEILLAERESIENKDHDTSSYCLDKNELSDVLDEANINIQATKELRFRNRELFYLKKLNKSLDRIKRGTYGLCEDCDGPIGIERLMARPTAELCIHCKEESELSEKNNFFQNKSKSLGQTISDLNCRSQRPNF
ncbi:MAG: hypothetical protein A2504_07840 [Bdellovibrionales bacterium RIFOXYD12_FULL_39_22]|nr:MAG: hypothetical protein A2385_11165 [Bdellovibrionales bacterium RIFOXYB1_FULL_39_21]OFZ41259.1 MAG: hypothetical protein A2485_00520 [Bdellovibrionales bacterium RIFOXYC12_FULL_39_17]OFZ45091.1 MAG: hypothetical protein A2404_11460 [Bdellovibrionales bacterium RIFOXYC1_FULL_39_130]OFZ74475.1 MAG: hypothetical protein A2560_11495 [Bdellovibrionales bacterium RIFOXYD1_FULL_39_84]OFZ92487.1 MAG: hypothetical protein A2504_07840 [Bdellovibrionales bacterium RIFOXYD12_FULL_39_22]HLE12449.1 Tr